MAQARAHGTRRVWVPATAFAVFALAVLLRLIQLQILDHPRYARAAHEELTASDVIYARRGAILDRNGNALATSVDTWDFYVNARTWKDPAKAERSAQALAAALHVDAARLRATVAASTAIDVLVARDVEYETGKELIDSGAVDGLNPVPSSIRVNPERDTAASILGFIGRDKTGLAGIEAAYNEVLQGKPGRAVYERDTAGDPIPFGRRVTSNPLPGKDVVLTIDRYLQRMAEQRLEEAVRQHRAKGGAIIMMDPSTGEIYALATQPGLKYSTLDLSDAKQIELLRNRAVTDLYEPGSVMKVITAAAAIDAGAVTPDTTYVDTGTAYIYGIALQNWDFNTYGLQDMRGVLRNSINTGAIFMMQQLERIQPGGFQRYLDAFGFGKPTGVDLQGEASGIIRRPTHPGWSPVDLATQAFGQSISVTPLQMAAAVAAAINGGNLVRPPFVRQIVGPGGSVQDVKPEIVGRAISAQASATMRDMMHAVMDPGHFPPKDYTAGGKSGTANVPIPNGYDDRQVASFVEFAPLDNPRLLVFVKLDENADLLTGTAAAAPIASRIMDDALHYLNVPADAGKSAVTR
ncbi:MAG: penicillin-binding protein 2 [Dehalococcoidia bacterium]|nr:penicillin-binding protein 2 [Dehalococcoidia bacterium]